MNCPKCGLPKELCVCEDITRGAQKVRVRKDRRAFGKFVTVVDGFDDVDVSNVAKELKRKLACGGTIKDGKIELQGDHSTKVKDVLTEMGFPAESID
jgi:translation initiation factor 1